MSDSFPRVSFWRHGYATERVDAFFADARQAYEGGLPAEQFSAQQVRQATFPLKRRGYTFDAVDSAMSRLEAAFVQRDRADHIAVNGEAAWFEKVAARATTLYDRLMRPRGERFSHPESGRGYDAALVDDLLDRLAAYFDEGTEMSVDDGRLAGLQPARGKKGYTEGTVDAYLGRAVEILLAVS